MKKRDRENVIEETVTEKITETVTETVVEIDLPDAPPPPSNEPLIVIAKFARSIKNKDLAGAYAHVEGMRRPIRRMTQADWQKDFDAWCAAPRR